MVIFLQELYYTLNLWLNKTNDEYKSLYSSIRIIIIININL